MAVAKLAKCLEEAKGSYEESSFTLKIYAGNKANVSINKGGLKQNIVIMGDNINPENREKILAMVTAYIYSNFTIDGE